MCEHATYKSYVQLLLALRASIFEQNPSPCMSSFNDSVAFTLDTNFIQGPSDVTFTLDTNPILQELSDNDLPREQDLPLEGLLLEASEGRTNIDHRLDKSVQDLSNKLLEMKVQWCRENGVCLASLEKRLYETHQKRSSSTWTLWQRSDMSKQAFVKAGIEATVGEFERMFGTCQSILIVLTDNMDQLPSIDFTGKKISKQTQFLARRAKKSGEFYQIEKERIGVGMLRKLLERDVYGNERASSISHSKGQAYRKAKRDALLKNFLDWVRCLLLLLNV